MTTTQGTGMDFESSMLVESVAEFRRQEIDDRARELDEDAAAGAPEELFGRLAPLGLTTALVSEAAGGQGMDIYSFCLALREVARGSAGLAVVLLSHNLALRALEAAGADLPEEGGRAALAWPARREGGGAVAPFVPGGTEASTVVFMIGGKVFAAAPGGGAEVEEIERPMGWRACRPATVTLAADAQEAGAPGDEAVADLEGALLAGVAATALGISAHAFEQARSYATERWQACDYIINHQQVRVMLGAMAAGIQVAEAALGRVTRGPVTAGVRAVKFQACENAMRDATDAVQIHGGYGYMRDYGMELLMRDAKTCQVYPRTPGEELLELL